MGGALRRGERVTITRNTDGSVYAIDVPRSPPRRICVDIDLTLRNGIHVIRSVVGDTPMYLPEQVLHFTDVGMVIKVSDVIGLSLVVTGPHVATARTTGKLVDVRH